MEVFILKHPFIINKYAFSGILLIFIILFSSCNAKKLQDNDAQDNTEQNLPQVNIVKTNEYDIWFTVAGGAVKVTPATYEILSSLDDYYDVTEEYSPYNIDLIFVAGAYLRDFRYASIELDFDHEYIRIIEREVRVYLNLSPGEAFLVSWIDIGLMPTAGISFIDENNQRRYFSISANNAEPEEGGYTPILLGEYPGISSDVFDTEIQVNVMPASNEVLNRYNSYSTFIDNDTGAYQRLLFTTNITARDFWYIEISHYEDPFFLNIESVLYRGDLLPDLPLVVTLTEISRIPQRGISYIDENNTRKYFYIAEDGMDNNVYHLSEFHPDPYRIIR